MAFQIQVIKSLILCYIQQNSHKLHVSFESQSVLALIHFSWHEDTPVKYRASQKLCLSVRKCFVTAPTLAGLFLLHEAQGITFFLQDKNKLSLSLGKLCPCLAFITHSCMKQKWLVLCVSSDLQLQLQPFGQCWAAPAGMHGCFSRSLLRTHPCLLLASSGQWSSVTTGQVSRVELRVCVGDAKIKLSFSVLCFLFLSKLGSTKQPLTCNDSLAAPGRKSDYPGPWSAQSC